jgi:hypothetical protein
MEARSVSSAAVVRLSSRVRNVGRWKKPIVCVGRRALRGVVLRA